MRAMPVATSIVMTNPIITEAPGRSLTWPGHDEQVDESALAQLGDVCEDGGEPCLPVDIVYLRGDDQAVHSGSAHSSAPMPCRRIRRPSPPSYDPRLRNSRGRASLPAAIFGDCDP